jgi:hypothetical protein
MTDKLGGSGDHRANYFGFNFEADTYTISCAARVKAGIRTLRIGTTNYNNFNAEFNLVNGTCTGAGASIAPLTDGWYRCSLEITAVKQTSYIQYQISNGQYVGDGSSIEIAELQLQRGTLTPYQPIALPVFQSTTAKKPVLSARKNLLLATEDFSNAAWSKNACTAANAAGTAPDGTNSAVLITGTGGANLRINSVINGKAAVPTSYTYSVYLRADTLSDIRLGDANSGELGRFDLTTGTCAGATAVIEPAGAGWYRCSITYTGVNPQMAIFYSAWPGGTSTGSFYLWHPQAELGPTATTYQRVTTTTDYDTVGFPSGAKFDGIDDTLLSVNFGITGPQVRTMCLAVKWLGNNVAAFANHGYWVFGAGVGIRGADGNLYNLEGNSGGNRVNSDPNYPIPNSASVIALNKPKDPFIEIQVNGVKKSNTAVQGGDFGNNVPFALGTGQGYNDPANCVIMAVVLINRELTQAEQDAWNTYAYQLLGITP